MTTSERKWTCIKLEILTKENNIVKRKFKEGVAVTPEINDNLLNKNDERKVISDIWSP